MSVIIPFYQGVSWLMEAVDSVVAQTRPVYEIIVGDIGSPQDISLFSGARGAVVVCDALGFQQCECVKRIVERHD